MRLYTTENNYSHFGVKDKDQKYFKLLSSEDFTVEPRKQAKLDGYRVGERLLEGMHFLLTINDDGRLSVETPQSAKDYMSKLNEERWLKKALDYAKDNDFFEGLDGLEDINLVMTNGKYNFEKYPLPTPKVIGKVKL
tara:strand:- start:4 stop:414 length:411 start_codon:yes stop_codon:yes gene_type:complete